MVDAKSGKADTAPVAFSSLSGESIGSKTAHATGFVASLEMSRGVAALMVALLHIGQSAYFDVAKKEVPLVGATGPEQSISKLLLRILGNGHGAVVFFFVLSGFVLTLMLQRGSQQTGEAAWRFFVSRIFRIFPAIFTTLVLFAAVYVLIGRATAPPDHFTIGNFLMNALLLRTNINGVMWSLQLEIIAVPLIFIAFLMQRRWGTGVVIFLTVVLVALSFSKGWNQAIGPPFNFGQIYCFLAGMLACLAGYKFKQSTNAGVWLVAGLLGFAVARPLLGWWSNWSVVFETISASFIVASLAYGRFSSANIFWLAAPLQFYGRISYSFYLLHPLTLVVCWQMQDQLTAAVSANWSPLLLVGGMFIASVVAITPLAWLQSKYVEQYGIALGRRAGGYFRPFWYRPA